MSDTFLSPKNVYQEVEKRFGRPGLDPCWHYASHIRPVKCFALPENYRPYGPMVSHTPELLGNCGLAGVWPKIWTPDKSMLKWTWMNHPYSDSAPWIDKIINHHSPFIVLLKSDTSVKWFHNLWSEFGVTMGFFKGRLTHEDPSQETEENNAKFSSALAVRGLNHLKIDLPIHWAGQYRNILPRSR